MLLLMRDDDVFLLWKWQMMDDIEWQRHYKRREKDPLPQRTGRGKIGGNALS